MINDIVRRMFRGWAAKKPEPPQFDIHEWSRREGWVCLDKPQGRRGRVRFRFDPGGLQIPRAVPPAPSITGAGFVSGGGGHVEHHADAPKQVARPVPPRIGIPTAPRADSFYGKVRG